MNSSPIAFMSYDRQDDDDRRLSELRTRLSGEVAAQLGEPFPIFQDREDIAWGEQWQKRIDESLDNVTFLIPIVTPRFFRSRDCRAELERFLKREQKLGRGDLILPVYYIDAPILNDPAKRSKDTLADVIHNRQYSDWRPLRFKPFTSTQIGETIAKMAMNILAGLERPANVEPESAPPPTSRTETASSAKITDRTNSTLPSSSVVSSKKKDWRRAGYFGIAGVIAAIVAATLSQILWQLTPSKMRASHFRFATGWFVPTIRNLLVRTL